MCNQGKSTPLETLPTFDILRIAGKRFEKWRQAAAPWWIFLLRCSADNCASSEQSTLQDQLVGLVSLQIFNSSFNIWKIPGYHHLHSRKERVQTWSTPDPELLLYSLKACLQITSVYHTGLPCVPVLTLLWIYTVCVSPKIVRSLLQRVDIEISACNLYLFIVFVFTHRSVFVRAVQGRHRVGWLAIYPHGRSLNKSI